MAEQVVDLFGALEKLMGPHIGYRGLTGAYLVGHRRQPPLPPLNHIFGGILPKAAQRQGHLDVLRDGSTAGKGRPGHGEGGDHRSQIWVV